MRAQEPMTQTIEASDARQRWSDLLNQISRKETRVIVEQSGVPVAAVISTDDLARLDHYDRERAARFKVLDDIGAAFHDTTPEEIEREVSRALAEVRAETRQERSEATPRS
jgi:prevent-host-death family protein